MCSYYEIPCIHVKQDYNKTPDANEAEELLKTHPEITHIMMIHSETTSGILNDIEYWKAGRGIWESIHRGCHVQLCGSGDSGKRLVH